MGRKPETRNSQANRMIAPAEGVHRDRSGTRIAPLSDRSGRRKGHSGNQLRQKRGHGGQRLQGAALMNQGRVHSKQDGCCITGKTRCRESSTGQQEHRPPRKVHDEPPGFRDALLSKGNSTGQRPEICKAGKGGKAGQTTFQESIQ